MASAVKVLHVCTIQLTAQVFISPIARYLRARLRGRYRVLGRGRLGWAQSLGRLGGSGMSALSRCHPADDPAIGGPARRLATLPADPVPAAGDRM